MRPSLKITLLSILLVVALPVQATDRPGRAAIASAHPLASAAGMDVLEAGGNAFDAAVAVSAAQAVVVPYGAGLGGGGFWLLHRAEDRFETLVDGREKAPLAATADMYLDASGQPITKASREGPLAAGIPGMPAALVYIAETYGALPLSKSLEPAIGLARDGFPVWPRLRAGLVARRTTLARSPVASEVFLVEGEAPGLGHVIVQPQLAETLGRIAAEGHDGFYRGPVAHALVEGAQGAGGIWTLEDLEAYSVVEREPIVATWRGTRALMAPPPSAGGVALANIFQILSSYDLNRHNRVEQVHLIVEAMRRAFRDRALYLGDPDFVSVPVERLTHPFYAAGQRASIRLDRATPSASLPGFKVVSGGDQTTTWSRPPVSCSTMKWTTSRSSRGCRISISWWVPGPMRSPPANACSRVCRRRSWNRSAGSPSSVPRAAVASSAWWRLRRSNGCVGATRLRWLACLASITSTCPTSCSTSPMPSARKSWQPCEPSGTNRPGSAASTAICRWSPGTSRPAR
jgi:gamma-glutamyltranspeptidase/glutathione hydrolase